MDRSLEVNVRRLSVCFTLGFDNFFFLFLKNLSGSVTLFTFLLLMEIGLIA